MPQDPTRAAHAARATEANSATAVLAGSGSPEPGRRTASARRFRIDHIPVWTWDLRAAGAGVVEVDHPVHDAWTAR